ncbi:hypothetical protein FIM12_04810 [SAR202 cluster bacterium AD-804-J14_MRT_500m]|nr:hypothetical protein [SAR202 cluster bacterium AD-804-J14_MRT_500m]
MNSENQDTPDFKPLTLDDETFRILEFPEVKARAGDFCALGTARSRILKIKPSHDLTDIRTHQQETQEARVFLESHDPLEMSGVHDIDAYLYRASLDGMLQGPELRELHDTLQTSRSIRGILGNRNDLPILSKIGSSIPDLIDLQRLLSSTIDETGLIRDGASKELHTLRTEASGTKARLDETLDRAIRRLRRNNILQEPLVTERNGRMVLLVKIEQRLKVPGIVHDISDSGATAFIEPMIAIGLGNQWREITLNIRREEERILRTVSSAVGYNGLEIYHTIEALVRLDIAMAMGRYSIMTDGTAPIFVQAEKAFINLSKARHPLLRQSAVPIDISIGGRENVMLITGPNAGGKTVALKTIGLLAIMAQSGFHLPALECTMTAFDHVYADIGDRQSIEQSLSSFSSHLQTLRYVMTHASPISLVLLDELGSSTDPEEGAALAKAILHFFGHRQIPCVATTHHREVAAYVQDQSEMDNASVELDPATLEPTFKLTKGLPGRSYALTIATRMGMDPDTITLAQSLLSEEHRRSEVLLRQLEQERFLVTQQRIAADQELERNLAIRRNLEGELSELQSNKDQLLEQTKLELQNQADDLLKRLQKAQRAFTQPQGASENSQSSDYRRVIADIKSELKSSKWQPSPKDDHHWIQQIKEGDFVYVRGIPNPVEVLIPPNENRTVEIALGAIRARLPSHQLERKADIPVINLPDRVSYTGPVSRPIGREIDVRGMRVEEAGRKLDSVLDQAVLQGLRDLKIVHGSGSGALRSFIRERLKVNLLVKEIKLDDTDSADGVTLVELT